MAAQPTGVPTQEGRVITWFKVDDGFSDHPKVKSIPRSVRAAAVGLWTLAGSWSAKNLTDGFVPDYMLAELGCTRGQAAALVQAELWRRAGDGYVFHDWVDHQPSSEKVKERRAKTAERVARWRATHGQDVTADNAVSNGVTNSVTNGVSNAAPDPTRPDPNSSAPTERATPPATPRRRTPRKAAETPPVEESLNGGHLVKEWIDSCNRRPPGDVVGMIAQRVGNLLDEGFDPDDIREGLRRWKAKDVHASVLPSLVNEVVNSDAPAVPQSAAEKRIGETADALARLKARRSAKSTHDPDTLAIGGVA